MINSHTVSKLQGCGFGVTTTNNTGVISAKIYLLGFSCYYKQTRKFILFPYHCSYIIKCVYHDYHKIIESLRLEKTSKIIKSNHQSTPPCLLSHVPKCHIYTFFEHIQG